MMVFKPEFCTMTLPPGEVSSRWPWIGGQVGDGVAAN